MVWCELTNAAEEHIGFPIPSTVTHNLATPHLNSGLPQTKGRQFPLTYETTRSCGCFRPEGHSTVFSLVETLNQYVILGFRCGSKGILPSWLLRDVRRFDTEISGLPIGSIFKSLAVQGGGGTA
jgi:hypothetical protein